MNNIVYKSRVVFKEEDILSLYNDVGWTNYMEDMSKLIEAVESSLFCVSAWDGDKLVGLIRIVGDGLTIIYIQDILVMSAYKRKGIGSELLKHALDKYKNVRQKVLITDESEETRGFYEANSFTSTNKFAIAAFVKFNWLLIPLYIKHGGLP